MDLLQQTDELFFARTNLDLERTSKIVRDALAGGDDGELFLEMRHAEMLAFDDGRLKNSELRPIKRIWPSRSRWRGAWLCPCW